MSQRSGNIHDTEYCTQTKVFSNDLLLYILKICLRILEKSELYINIFVKRFLYIDAVNVGKTPGRVAQPVVRLFSKVSGSGLGIRSGHLLSLLRP